MSRPFSSFRSKIAVALTLTAVFSVALMAVIGVGLIRQAEEAVAVTELRRQVDAVSGEAALVRGQPRQILRILRRTLALNNAAVYNINSQGELILLDGDPDLRLSGSDAARLQAGETVEGRRAAREGEILFVAKPLSDGPKERVLVVGRPSGSTVGLAPSGPRILAAAAIAAAIAALVSFLLSNRVAAPMRELANGARVIAKGDFSRRVPVHSEDEIGVVAESFNSMAAELGDSDKRQREFFLSLSHELRTPLTAIQGYGEAIEDGTAGSGQVKAAAGVIVRESMRLTRLVSDLLDLARFDARGFEVTLSAVVVDEVLAKVQENFGPKAKDSGVVIERARVAGAVRADPDRLVQVLSNLVENALRYTPPNHSIKLSASIDERSVAIAPSAAGKWIGLRVEDSGPGFDAEDLDHAFDRQYLWTKYRGLRDVGTGLGLAITKELTEAMGGTVRAVNASAGGAVFVVELPAYTEI